MTDANMFGSDKILDPEHAEHVRGVVIRAINRHTLHSNLGIVRERIADAVAQALTGKEMRPGAARHATIRAHRAPAKSPVQLDREISRALSSYRRGR